MTLQVMDEALTQYADLLLKVVESMDRLADEVKSISERVQVLENER
jgi:hypothetical protein